MTAEQEKRIRELVDAGGWDAVRADPELWKVEQERRAASRKWVDQNIDRD